jgi:hypothetical protein
VVASEGDELTFIVLPLFVVRTGALDTVVLLLPRLPYPLPKREVKEEYETLTPWRRCVIGGSRTIHEPSQQHQASGGRLNDRNAWAGKIDDVIALSICDSGMPLTDLLCDDNKVGPSGAVKKEPAAPRGRTSCTTRTTISALAASSAINLFYV